MKKALRIFGSFIFIILLPVVVVADPSVLLRVREFPSAIRKWDQVRDFVLKDQPQEGLQIEEVEKGLTLRLGRDIYQIMMYGDDIIQYSTVTMREMGIEDSVQFGRTSVRSFRPYLEFSPSLSEMYAFLDNSGVRFSDKQIVPGIRSALHYPENGEAPTIYVSEKSSKHPIFGVAHEMQHFMNQPILPMLVDRILKDRPYAMDDREMMRSFLDEYLAVAREVNTFKDLSSRFPHLTGQEIVETRSLSDSDMKEYVFSKWKSYYRWSTEFWQVLKRVDLNSREMLSEVHSFQMRFGTMKDIPSKYRRLIEFEQRHNPKVVDPAVIASPDNSHLPWAYKPEASLSFPIRTVWIPEKDLNIAVEADVLPESIRMELSRNIDGVKSYAFFVHPLSEKEYADLVRRYPSTFEYIATPGSSNRTLFVRSVDSSTVFYVKTSLAVEIAGAKRTIPLGEVSRSVGHSHFLRGIAGRDHRVIFLPEPLGVIPKGMERGGQIVRLVEPNRKSSDLLPLFSFYSQKDGVDLSGELSRKLGLSRSTFIERWLARPLLNLLLDLRDSYGVVHEAHAQNILVEVASDGMPTGRFVFKDLAGLNVDFSRHSDIYSRTPYFVSREREFFQKERDLAAKQSIDSYFKAGFLYGVDQYLVRTDVGYEKGAIQKIIETDSRRVNLCKSVFL